MIRTWGEVTVKRDSKNDGKLVKLRAMCTRTAVDDLQYCAFSLFDARQHA